MTRSEFWALIGSTRDADPDRHAERLTDALAGGPADEILSFGDHFDALEHDAYTWNLWAAAYVMNGGCSDDGFIDFRSWLILQGEAVYGAALADPDSLAALDVGPDAATCECYIAATAYERATGVSGHNGYYAALEQSYPGRPPRAEPMGDEWDEDDPGSLQALCPKLFAKYG